MNSQNIVHVIMTSEDIDQTLSRFAREISTSYPDIACVAIVGVQTGGAHLARRLTQKLLEMTGKAVDLGILDITLYRDDLDMERGAQPIVRKTELPFKISGKIIILVDDVLYTGRTIRAALDALIDFGRPKAIRLAVIIDRGLREFPIRPDYVGKSIETQSVQKVHVKLIEESAQNDQVLLEMGD